MFTVADDSASPTREPQSETPAPAAPTKESVVVLLAAGRSVTAAAAETGLHRSTIHNWLNHDPRFAGQVRSARAEYGETLRDKLRDQSARALDTLTELMADPKTPASVRLRAALAILERPRFPEPGWNLPEPVETAQESRMLEQLAVVNAGYRAMRESSARDAQVRKLQGALAETRQKSTLFDTNSGFSVTPAAQPSRNSLCPCGSGQKYKRCCGRSAPPVLTARPAA